MCRSGNYANSNDDAPKNWLGGFYQVYTAPEELPDITNQWANFELRKGLDALTRAFPVALEAYCVLAFLAAAEEHEDWAGATYHYLDRLACILRREHSKRAWKRLWKWISSFGRVNDLTRFDVWNIVSHEFVSPFWGSMRRLITGGYVRVESREIEDIEDVAVFFPTVLLVEKINTALAK